jgi:hypothetical protein
MDFSPKGLLILNAVGILNSRDAPAIYSPPYSLVDGHALRVRNIARVEYRSLFFGHCGTCFEPGFRENP